MATKTFYLTAALGDGWRTISETSEIAATSTDGWVVGTGSTLHSEYQVGTERASTTFTGTTVPDGTLDTSLKDAFRSSTAINGTFIAANWTFTFVVRPTTSATSQNGRIRFRVIKAAADGSGATEITSAQQQGSLTGAMASTSTDFTSSLTVSLPAMTFTATEYLFIQIAWERTGAASMTTADVNWRTGSSSSAGTRIVTSDFIPPQAVTGATANIEPNLGGLNESSFTLERGQSFIGDGRYVTAVTFWMRQSGGASGNAQASIYAASGTHGSTAIPTGSALATSSLVDVSGFVGSGSAPAATTFSFPTPCLVTAGTTYVATVNPPTSVSTGFANSTHSGNSSVNVPPWTSVTPGDLRLLVTTETVWAGSVSQALSVSGATIASGSVVNVGIASYTQTLTGTTLASGSVVQTGSAAYQIYGGTPPGYQVAIWRGNDGSGLDTSGIGQAFTVSSAFNTVDLDFSTFGSPDGTVNIQVWTAPASSGTVLATATIAASSIPGPRGWTRTTFNTTIVPGGATTYYLRVYLTGNTVGSVSLWYTKVSLFGDAYPGHSAYDYSSPNWTVRSPAADYHFRIPVIPQVFAPALVPPAQDLSDATLTNTATLYAGTVFFAPAQDIGGATLASTATLYGGTVYILYTTPIWGRATFASNNNVVYACPAGYCDTSGNENNVRIGLGSCTVDEFKPELSAALTGSQTVTVSLIRTAVGTSSTATLSTWVFNSSGGTQTVNNLPATQTFGSSIHVVRSATNLPPAMDILWSIGITGAAGTTCMGSAFGIGPPTSGTFYLTPWGNGPWATVAANAMMTLPFEITITAFGVDPTVFVSGQYDVGLYVDGVLQDGSGGAGGSVDTRLTVISTVPDGRINQSLVVPFQSTLCWGITIQGTPTSTSRCSFAIMYTVAGQQSLMTFTSQTNIGTTSQFFTFGSGVVSATESARQLKNLLSVPVSSATVGAYITTDPGTGAQSRSFRLRNNGTNQWTMTTLSAGAWAQLAFPRGGVFAQNDLLSINSDVSGVVANSRATATYALRQSPTLALSGTTITSTATVYTGSVPAGGLNQNLVGTTTSSARITDSQLVLVDSWWVAGDTAWSQSVVGNGKPIVAVEFGVYRDSDAAGSVVAELWSAIGTHGTDALPDALLATSNVVDIASLPLTPGYVLFTFTTNPILTLGTTYCLVLRQTMTGAGLIYVGAADNAHSGNAGYFQPE